MVLLVVDTQKLITTTDLYNFNAFELSLIHILWQKLHQYYLSLS